jgi:acyl-CoA thioester hydrolase
MLITPSPQADFLVMTTVEHVDVDSYQIVHFSRYVSLTETAALVFLARHMTTLPALEKEGLQLRVRELRMQYKAPSALGDVLLLACRLSRLAIASMSFDIDIRKADLDRRPTDLVASGFLNIVPVLSSTGQPVPLSESLVKQLTDNVERT